MKTILEDILMKFLKEQDGAWTGTSSELLNHLNSLALRKNIDVDSHYWPKSPNTLSRRLHRINNIRVVNTDRNKGKRVYNITIKSMSELDKWAKDHDDVVVIDEFLDHICNNGYAIHKHYDVDDSLNPPQKLQPVFEHERRKLIEKFFDIDAEKLEQERRALLKEDT